MSYDGAFDDGSFSRTDISGASRDELVESLHTLLETLPETTINMYIGHGDPSRVRERTNSVGTVIERALERAERFESKY